MSKIIDAFNYLRSSLSKEIRVFNAGETTDMEKAPYLYDWFWTTKLGKPRGINFIELRQFAKCCWVQMVTNAITKQIMTMEWKITGNTEDIDVESYDKDIKEIKKILETPNRNGDSFWEVWGPWLRDVLEIDAGVIWKGKNAAGKLVELYPYEGSRFLFNLTKHGNIEGMYQYSYMFPTQKPLLFSNDELIYGRMNLSTENYPYGFSPLQSILQEVELMIQSTRWNKERYKNNSVPDGIVTVPMDKAQMERFQLAWEKEVKGKAHKLLFHNSPGVDFKPFAFTNKDMEWLEGQKWYFHVVFGAYGLSPAEVGFHENVNRSSQEGQERTTVKNAILPYLKLISDKINTEVIPEIVGHSDLRFVWVAEDHVKEIEKHKQTMDKLTAGVITINEIRAEEGLTAVEWGDKPLNLLMQENFQSQNNDNDEEDNKRPIGNKKDEEEDDEEDNKRPIGNKKDEEETNKEFVIDAGEEMVEEADSYEAFLKSKFGKWETKITAHLDKVLTNTLDKAYIEKTFGEFLQLIFNSINTLGFQKSLRNIIKVHLKQGIEEVEQEFDIDIGFGADSEEIVEHIVERQMDGFYIEGKRWAGIKGVAKDLQQSLTFIVVDGVNKGESVTKIKESIKEEFNKYTGTEMADGRATKIARTETNRMINFSRVNAVKQTGIKVKKIWNAKMDGKTSDICKELNGQKVNLNETFKGKGGEWEFPPSHPQCFIDKQKIMTVDGYKNILDISVGEGVLTHKNRHRKVIAKFKNKYSGFLYKIRTNKGLISCTANHPILTNTGWKEAQDITEKDFVLCIKQ